MPAAQSRAEPAVARPFPVRRVTQPGARIPVTHNRGGPGTAGGPYQHPAGTGTRGQRGPAVYDEHPRRDPGAAARDAHSHTNAATYAGAQAAQAQPAPPGQSRRQRRRTPGATSAGAQPAPGASRQARTRLAAAAQGRSQAGAVPAACPATQDAAGKAG